MKNNNEAWEFLTHNIIWLRKQLGYSRKKMAEVLEIGTGSLAKLEQGEIPPRLSANILFVIHYRFGIRPSDLLGRRLDE